MVVCSGCVGEPEGAGRHAGHQRRPSCPRRYRLPSPRAAGSRYGFFFLSFREAMAELLFQKNMVGCQEKSTAFIGLSYAPYFSLAIGYVVNRFICHFPSCCCPICFACFCYCCCYCSSTEIEIVLLCCDRLSCLLPPF